MQYMQIVEMRQIMQIVQIGQISFSDVVQVDWTDGIRMDLRVIGPFCKGRHLREKRDYVGKIPKRRTPTPPVWEFSHFFTVFVKLVMPFYKLLNWKKQ